MLGRVADLLRRMLQAPKTSEVTLDRELETLELYLEVMKARFEEKLQVEWNVDAALGGAAVPQLILQPLVENAIRHGIEPESARVWIEVGAAKLNGSLILTVRDHGKGVSSSSGSGIGLANTRGRLDRLYGNKARLDLENANGGGAEARIEIPFHSST
jgi:LytS/YehU family sensor histidine kinase